MYIESACQLLNIMRKHTKLPIMLYPITNFKEDFIMDNCIPTNYACADNALRAFFCSLYDLEFSDMESAILNKLDAAIDAEKDIEEVF